MSSTPPTDPTTPPRRRTPGSPHPEQHAHRVAAAIDTAWSAYHTTGTDLHIPLSVVAVLSLYGQPDPQGPSPADLIARLDPAGLAQVLRAGWRQFVMVRPDLALRVMPLARWITDDPSDWQLEGAHTVARAALRAGIHQLTDDLDSRRAIDLLGTVLEVLRGHGKASRGQFYTTRPVAEVLASLNGHADGPPGSTILEPTAGIGAMLCAAARVLRERDLDPADWIWVANDIDPLAMACLAVNAHLWGLGTNVFLGCGDVLDDSWIERAIQVRNAGIEALPVARMIVLLTQLPAGGEPPAT